MVIDSTTFLHNALKDDSLRIVGEGAQGVALDVDHGM